MDRTFRFVDDGLQRKFVEMLAQSGLAHRIDRDGVIHFSPDDEDVIENDLICSIRDAVFPSWQVLTCPPDWVGRYHDYMTEHSVPFQEEVADGERWFLLPRKYRPHSWKLGAGVRPTELAKARS